MASSPESRHAVHTLDVYPPGRRVTVQSETRGCAERVDLRDEENRPLRFGFFDFLPIGILSFVVIEAIAVAYALVVIHGG